MNRIPRTASRIASRVAALMLAAGVAAAVVTWVVMPLLSHMDRLDERIGIAAETGQRLAGRLADPAEREARIAALTRRIEESELYIRAETEALATAAIQQRLTRLAELNGAHLLTVEDLPARPGDGGLRIALRADIAATTDRLAALLYDLEADRPYLFVEALDIRSRSSGSRNEQPQPLSVRLEVAGYMLPAVTQ